MMGLRVAKESHMSVGMSEMFSLHAEEAVRLAYLLTLDRNTAQDVTRRAFLRVLGRFLDLKNPAEFTYHLRRTIVNQTHRRARRQRIRRFVGLPAPTRESAGPRPGRRDEIWGSLAVLAQRRRTALVLRYYADLSERETADLLGCSEGTVGSLASSGAAVVRDHLPSGASTAEVLDHLRRTLRNHAAEIRPDHSLEERVSTGARRRRQLLLVAIALLVIPILSTTALLGLGALDASDRDRPLTDPVLLLTGNELPEFELRGFVAATGEACYELVAAGEKADLCVLPDYEQELASAVKRIPALGKTVVWGWVADEVFTLEAIRADGLPVRDPLRNPVPLHAHPGDFPVRGSYFVAVFSAKKGTLHARAGDRRLLSSEEWIVPQRSSGRDGGDQTSS